ncbi:MAG: HEPN domain-containing protein [Calditrichaeota bacterium]|nr:HEPN domain-containing protein [Calditrichota bacterium]
MKEESRLWLKYSEENFESAKILLNSKLFNPCLQNVQQCVEKALKALLIQKTLKFKKTHSIFELRNLLAKEEIEINISDEECEFLDSIYLPSKYPLGSALPYYEPDLEICEKAVLIAEKALNFVKNILK